MQIRWSPAKSFQILIWLMVAYPGSMILRLEVQTFLSFTQGLLACGLYKGLSNADLVLLKKKIIAYFKSIFN